MSPAEPPVSHQIRKYPNRRYYDRTDGRHLTIGELHELVRSGHEIVVQDTKTGANITNLVLAQIILEHAPPKLNLFPSSLLHLAIRSGDNEIRRFVEQYVVTAMDAVAQSRRQFERFLPPTGAPWMPSGSMDWARMMFGGPRGGGPASPDSIPRTVGEDAPADPVASLRSEIEALREELVEMRSSTDRPPPAKRAQRPKSVRTSKSAEKKRRKTK